MTTTADVHKMYRSGKWLEAPIAPSPVRHSASSTVDI